MVQTEYPCYDLYPGAFVKLSDQKRDALFNGMEWNILLDIIIRYYYNKNNNNENDTIGYIMYPYFSIFRKNNSNGSEEPPLKNVAPTKEEDMLRVAT
jgi:hypothetical protein